MSLYTFGLARPFVQQWLKVQSQKGAPLFTVQRQLAPNLDNLSPISLTDAITPQHHFHPLLLGYSSFCSPELCAEGGVCLLDGGL
eukprot:54888-Eustigmatos_ZCMA.PRE.1